MKLRLFALLIISMILLSSCTPEVAPPPAPTPEPSPTPTPSPSPSATPLPPASSPPSSQMPLGVTLHYIGVKSNQVTSGATNIYLLLVVSDGYEKAVDRFLPASGTFTLNSYQTIELNQEVFHTDSAGDSLKVCILAYKQNDPRWFTSILTPALSEIERGLAWSDYRSANEILSTVDKHMKNSSIDFANGGDTLIGYYEDVWGENESLGIGQYSGVGSDDFRLWFTIWSTRPPLSPPHPALLPDVSLDNVNMVSTVRIGQTRTDIIRIKNEELHPVTVTLKGSSSITGDFHNNTIEVPAEGYSWIENRVVSDRSGIGTISYNLYFRDTRLDAWSGDLKVTAANPYIALVQWRNSDGSVPIERTLNGTPVTLYVEAPGYDGSTLAASIRRVGPDGGYIYEEMVEIVILYGRGLGRWTAEWHQDADGDPRYVFGVKDVYGNELTVAQKYEPPPDVSIDNVGMVSYVNAGEVRTDTVTIKNNESELVVIRLKGYSSVDDKFYDSAVSVPADDYASVKIQTSCGTSSLRTITYKLSFQGADFDSWSGLLEVF